MEGIPELAEQVFDLPVRRGHPMGVGGLADVVSSPIYATGVGLVLFGARRRSQGTVLAGRDGAGVRKIIRRMREWFTEIF